MAEVLRTGFRHKALREALIGLGQDLVDVEVLAVLVTYDEIST